MAFPVYDFYSRSRPSTRWAWLALVALSASIAGNLLDDLFVPYTTDFIQVFDSPSANFADLFSYVGLGALAIEIVLYWRTTRPKWLGWRYHIAQKAQIIRAFLAHLKGNFIRRP
jgi:lipoprotein signal peptidase